MVEWTWNTISKTRRRVSISRPRAVKTTGSGSGVLAVAMLKVKSRPSV